MTFQPPEFWNFPPFFTIQPISETKQKQLTLWKELILQYHSQKNSFIMTPSSFPFFENKTISRKLSIQGINEIIDFMRSSGNAEWEDVNKTRLRIIWKTPETLAGDIYSWASRNGFLDNVFTVFELISGDEHQDSGFFGTDASLFKRALQILERSHKCVIIEGANIDEDGVKFV